MKAIQVVKPGQLEIIEKDMPQIQHDNEVLIQVKMVGICGSDIHIYHGTSPVATYPRVIGHEVTGQVVKIGEEVTSFRQVTMLSSNRFSLVENAMRADLEGKMFVRI